MIFGRSTVQIMALITATLQFVKQVTPVLLPQIDPAAMGVVLDSLSALLAVWIAVLANTSTTPIGDPQLKANTMITVTDDAGTVIGHEPVPTPKKPAEPAVPED